MPELRMILPRPANVAKGRRCAEGPSVKTMLHDPIAREGVANRQTNWQVQYPAEQDEAQVDRTPEM